MRVVAMLHRVLLGHEKGLGCGDMSHYEDNPSCGITKILRDKNLGFKSFGEVHDACCVHSGWFSGIWVPVV
jgi:hypothetical protein